MEVLRNIASELRIKSTWINILQLKFYTAQTSWLGGEEKRKSKMEQVANKCASASYLYASPASKPMILLPEHVFTGELHFIAYYIPRLCHLCKPNSFLLAVNSVKFIY